VPQGCEVIRHGGALPAMPNYSINLYRRPGSDLAERLAGFIRSAYCCPTERVAAAE
jgi:hypothetical protein